jgi:hypothetical protein
LFEEREMLANMLTKPLQGSAFELLRDHLLGKVEEQSVFLIFFDSSS